MALAYDTLTLRTRYLCRHNRLLTLSNRRKMADSVSSAGEDSISLRASDDEVTSISIHHAIRHQYDPMRRGLAPRVINAMTPLDIPTPTISITPCYK